MLNTEKTPRPSQRFKDKLLTHHSGGRHINEQDSGNVSFLIVNSTHKKTSTKRFHFLS